MAIDNKIKEKLKVAKQALLEAEINLQYEIVNLWEDRKEEAEYKMEDYADREPENPDTKGYEKWEERMEVLEDKLADIEAELECEQETLDELLTQKDAFNREFNKWLKENF